MAVAIQAVRRLCSLKALRPTNHFMIRALQRGIGLISVEYALMNGEIIEDYPDDYPYPSCLILGLTPENKYIHVVCGIGNGQLWLITVYYPSCEEWSQDFKVRTEAN